MVCEGKTTVAADEKHAKKKRHVKKWDKVQDFRSQRQLEILEQISMAMQQPQQQQQKQQLQDNIKQHEDKVKDLAGDTASNRSGSKCDEAAFDNSAVHKKDADDGNNKEILTLMNERRSINKEDKERLREVNKKIEKCIRDKKKPRRQQKIMQTFEELKGIKKSRTSNPYRREASFRS